MSELHRHHHHRHHTLRTGVLLTADLLAPGRDGAADARLRAVVRVADRRGNPPERRKLLIVVFQRGAVDGLNMVVP